ncbi:MAG: B12-binding domain-containing radical SAM protein [Acidobacteria bacterium]|nr:B12-binding domain-containing radical SAM protein [Acidobacteriota bacterium]
MRVLLISMPDTMYLFRWAQARVPNLAISSIAGNLDRRAFDVKLLDLVVEPYGVRSTVKQLVEQFKPHVVGLTSMSFQYRTASRIAALVKSIDPSIKIVLGGYHATMAYDEIRAEGDSFDFLVRGEGEATARELMEGIESGSRAFDRIHGLSFRAGQAFVHNAARPLLDPAAVALPDRESRVYGYRGGWNGGLDCVETSRGCYMKCSFCSISEMYGQSFRKFSTERVIEDIRRVKALGGKRVFFSDDNITIDVARFKQLCQAIIDNGLSDMRYSTQASAVGIASSEDLVGMMRAANFTLVFLGIEGIDEAKLKFMKKGRIVDHSIRSIELLHKNGIAIAGGFITGLPDDTPEDIRKVFRFASNHRIAVPIVWCSTPYPRTKFRDDLIAEGLVVNETNYYRYNGWNTNVRTRHISRARLSFERTRCYLAFLFRAAVLGDNHYVRKAREASFLRMVLWRLSAIKLFWRGITGTWQSTHSTSFYSWRDLPLMVPISAIARLRSRTVTATRRGALNAAESGQGSAM